MVVPALSRQISSWPLSSLIVITIHLEPWTIILWFDWLERNTDFDLLILETSNGKPPYDRNPDFTGITANMIFWKIYLIVLCATW